MSLFHRFRAANAARPVRFAKTRIITMLIAGVVTIQVWPNAAADEHRPAPAAVAKEAEVKAPKKSSPKKKSRASGHAPVVKQSSPWRLAPVAAQLSAKDAPAKKKRIDPIKLVLKTAYKQLGKPYRWGAVGPSSFDCSGFTMYVYGKAGVSLPHNSGAQRAATKHVPLDKMKPGDLIFSSGHVGMYVGKGKMIHSPRSGRTVSVDPVHSRAYGAGRPLA